MAVAVLCEELPHELGEVWLLLLLVVVVVVEVVVVVVVVAYP